MCSDQQRTWLRPTLSEVPDTHLDPQGSLLRSNPWKVPDSCLNPQLSLALAHLLSNFSSLPSSVECAVSGMLWPSPASTNVPGLNLFSLQWSLLPQTFSGLGCWLSLASVEFTLPQACSGPGRCLNPTPVEFVASGLLSSPFFFCQTLGLLMVLLNGTR